MPTISGVFEVQGKGWRWYIGPDSDGFYQTRADAEWALANVLSMRARRGAKGGN